ncbi:MAG: DUF1841 family protein [Burkholderiaceae bacterium]
MFNPSKEDVRRFFCDAWMRDRQGSVLTPLEAMAVDWIRHHPEYHDELLNAAAALVRDYSVEEGRTNPFLHLSMHLAIAEQLSVDQPPGIRAAHHKLVERLGDEHDAAHAVMDCLGEVVWAAQRAGSPLPPAEMSARYLDCLERRASAD